MSADTITSSNLPCQDNRIVNALSEESRVINAISEDKKTFKVLGSMAQDLGVNDLAEQHDWYLYRIEIM